MDLQTSLLCLGIVIVSTVLIWFILTVSTRGQSYEEVVAESRRLAAQRGFLDDAKTKKKQQQNKKDKKAGKKVKEKQAKEQQATTSTSEVESDGQVDNGLEEEPAHTKPAHVEFVEEPAVVIVPEVIPPKPIKAKSKKGKEPKVKPILINKDDPSCINDVSTPPSPTVTETVNHFEQLHPKDEFELLHSSDKEGKDKKENKGSKHGKPHKGKQQLEQQKEPAKHKEPEPTPAPKAEKQPEPQEAPKEQRKGKKPAEKIEVVEKPSEAPAVSSSVNISQPANLTTDKILKQAYPLETAAPQIVSSLATGDVPTTNGPTQPQGKKKKNIQLHQLTMGGDGLNVNLLVKVLSDAPLSRSEIQILTDCLLNKQNGPVPEHSEWSEGPKDPMQKLKRQLAEKEKALTDEQEAHQALKAKLKELRASLNSEIAKVSQLLTSTEEMNVNHRNDMAVAQARLQRAVEEANVLRQQLHQLQSKLSAEADFSTQRAQLEMHIQGLSENKMSLTSALGNLQVEMNDLRASHSGLTGELHMAREQLMATQHHTQELSRQLEELTRIKADLEAKVVNATRSEQFIKQEASVKLKELNDAQNEIQRLSSAHVHAQKITMQYEKKQEEFDRQNQQLINDVTKLKSEKEELNNLVKELQDKLASEATPNGTTTPIKEDTVSVEKAVAAACSELEAKHSQQLNTLQRQLDQHRDKNNDLRTKNWKVMEALQAAEKKLQDLDKGVKATNDTNNLRDAISEAKLSEQKSTKEVLQRLFPKVDAKGNSHEEWLQNFASKVQEQINAVKLQTVTVVSATPNSAENQKAEAKLKEVEKQNTQLQALVDKYKRVIDDTEGVLSRLQSNVTEEEQRWAKQLEEKQQELDNLKKHSISQLKDEIESLQEAYEKEHKLRLELEQRGKGETNAFISAIASNKTSSIPLMADVEKLKEENARLTELVERLHHNGPSQLPSIPTLEQKPTKKRRSIAGWWWRKITFRRKKHKESRAADQGRRRSLGDADKKNLERKSSDNISNPNFKTL